MTRKTALLAGVAAALIGPGAAIAACLQPAEKTAFDVRALQSQLMVVALTCQQQDDYNNFVRRHMNELNNAQRGVTSYHRRVHGAQHQRQLDLYITNLANSQMQAGITRGSFFCREQAPLFQMAMQANTREELANLAVQRQIPQPLGAEPCPATPQRQQGTTQARTQSQPQRPSNPQAQPQRQANAQPQRQASQQAQPASATR
ncbi:hypothetical protein [Rubritepida flocculans]|uniref:hypothetical protein n=1 Tax=Rubritepida flocculans TaxID=182403 RepID=UPI00041F3715|nr:hypothetical protein [Rubritepida flocculans]